MGCPASGKCSACCYGVNHPVADLDHHGGAIHPSQTARCFPAPCPVMFFAMPPQPHERQRVQRQLGEKIDSEISITPDWRSYHPDKKLFVWLEFLFLG